MSLQTGIIYKNGKKFFPVIRHYWSNENYSYQPKNEYLVSGDYLKLLNNVVISKNPVDILNSISISDINLKTACVEFAFIYKNILKGNIFNDSTNEILQFLNLKVHPETLSISSIIKTIIKIKLKLIEMKDKMLKDDVCAEWVGILSGLMLYFDEYDIANFNKTNYLENIMRTNTDDDLE